MRSKLIAASGVLFVLIFASAFFRTPPPDIAGLTRPNIDPAVFEGGEAGPARPMPDEAVDAESDGESGGGLFSHLRAKRDGAEAPKALRPKANRVNRDELKPRVVRPRDRANRVNGNTNRLRPAMKEGAAETRLQKRRDLLAKRRAEREQAAEAGAPSDPAMDLPEIDPGELPPEEMLPEDELGDELGELPPEEELIE